MEQRFVPEFGRHNPNHLKGQSSPYLLQHQYNPVNWYAWGDEALQKAQQENKPILISIGYSACHWCHVMEHESFEDVEVAEIMNRHFVCIKVDREERPDIDHLYMTALQILTSQGGWPLNCFALPDTRPFWGGTYFPFEAWKGILNQVAQLYQDRTADLVKQAEQLTEGIAAAGFIEPSMNPPNYQLGDGETVFQNIMEYMDKVEGGTLRAPKFPLPANHQFLLHYHIQTGNKVALAQVELSLEKMAFGGIYDQIGGGFARYSTDALWKVPHFEKMLYDNGQLISLYANAWKVSKKPLYRNTVYETVAFVKRELLSPEGTFYAALDADSEGVEGKFYVWSETEIDEVLGRDSSIVKLFYQVGQKGNWENGENILLRIEYEDSFAKKMNLALADFQAILQQSNKKLLYARSKRIRPGLDNKVIVSWNALMINGLADAYAAFGEDEFLQMASIAADSIINKGIANDGKLYRSLTGNQPAIDGFLEDYAFLVQALIRLYEVSAQIKYLLEAQKLTQYAVANFSSPGTNLFSFSSVAGEKLKAPFYEVPDNVMPSSNSVMALNLYYLSHYFEMNAWKKRSLDMLADVRDQLLNQSISFTNWAKLLLHQLQPFFTVVVAGPDAEQQLKEINSRYLPNVLFAVAVTDNGDLPILANRYIPDEIWFYVCTDGSCRLPVRNLQEAIGQIELVK
jgi:uncharacterized protein YyaL (SSP411 family)